MNGSIARWTAAALFAATTLATAGCGFLGAEKVQFNTVQARALGDASGAKYVAFAAKHGTTDVLLFCRPPYDLNGSYETDMTFGLFDPAGAAGLGGNAVFGVEIDKREATPSVVQYYGCYAQYVASPAAGLNVFVATHLGNQGQHFFAGATKVDVTLVSNGTSLTISAADSAGAPPAFVPIATVAIASPAAPHQFGFGMFNVDAGAKVGFTRLRIPSNGSPSVAVPAEQDAMNACYHGILDALEAAYQAGATVPDFAAARDALAAATGVTGFGGALTQIAALPDSAEKTKAAKEAGKLRDALAKSFTTFDGIVTNGATTKKQKKAVAALNNYLTKKALKSMALITDALMPQALRDFLPAGGFHGIIK